MMNQFELELSQALRQAAREFRSGGLEGDFALRLERLADEARQPCLLAVVGRMKAGKSTFINAFLGQDLAKVGVTETTATINFFRYGQPADPALPVLCHWQAGSRPSPVSREFVDSLQGHDPQTLERASRIKYLEYRLPHPYLQRVNLVDTPGMAAVVSEHEVRLRAFMAEFRPDALVYLFGEVGRDTDRQFLEEFRQVVGEGSAAALQTLGVMAKIDLQPDFPSGPLNRATSLARQF